MNQEIIYLEEGNISIRQNFWKEIERSKKQYAHIVMIATKPDIIKQAPLYQELQKRGEFTSNRAIGKFFGQIGK